MGDRLWLLWVEDASGCEVYRRWCTWANSAKSWGRRYVVGTAPLRGPLTLHITDQAGRPYQRCEWRNGGSWRLKWTTEQPAVPAGGVG